MVEADIPGRAAPARERLALALAALAVLLILGGALGAGFLVLQSGKRVAAIEITQQIGVGQQIPLSAMQEVQIASGTDLSYVPWNQASQVARFSAATAIPPRTLLTNAMVGQASNASAGKAVLGLALKDGQLPAQLQVGDQIDIYQVSDGPESCPGSSGSALAVNAIVLDISSPPSASSSAVADVRVAVNPASAGAVACNSANGIVGIAIVPAGAVQGLWRALSGRCAGAPAAPAPSFTPSARPSQTTGTTTPGGQASSTPSPGTGTG